MRLDLALRAAQCQRSPQNGHNNELSDALYFAPVSVILAALILSIKAQDIVLGSCLLKAAS
jgi:hypothetical protein